MRYLFPSRQLLPAVMLLLMLLSACPAHAQENQTADSAYTELPESDSSDDLQSLEAPSFSLTPGIYTGTVQLEISSVHSGVEIRYTTDGSTPNQQSALYEGPLELGSREGDPNTISMIPTNAFGPGHPYNEHWQPPLGEVYKIHTIRAKVFTADGESGDITTGSYLIDEEGNERFSMPVISISTDPENLFDDDIGIYVAGSDPSSPNYNQRGREWEREAWMEFFEDDGSTAFAQLVGLRIHGGTSRSRPRKSLRVYARNDYGAPWINHQIFPDKPIGQFKRLILRNSGNDWDGTVFRDGYMQALIRGLDVDMQHFRPVIVFINGEYWGIHNIRDRLDNRYIQTHYGLSDEEDYTIMENNSVFDRGNPDGVDHYNQMRSFLNNPGVADPSNYAELQTRMDTENFKNYFISQIYYRNTDWPGNNLQYWRASTEPFDPDAPHGFDGRWRWMMFDTDFGFGLDFDYVTGANEGPAHNTLAFALQDDGPGWPNPPWSTFILRKLMENQTFRSDFINRTLDLLNTVFHPDYSVAVLDSVAAKFEPEMQEHIDRWRRPETTQIWLDDVEVMREFAQQRPNFLRQHTAAQFGLSGELATVTLDVNDDEKGYIRINRTDIRRETPGIKGDVYPWSGTYFSDHAITVTAVPRSGFEFESWQNGSESEEAELTLQPGEGITLKAVFVPLEDDIEVPIEPWPVAEGDFQFSDWPANAPAGIYPEHMKFYQTSVQDPDLHDERSDPWIMPYNLESRSRINGLGENGISFINTSNPQDDGGGFLGAAVLALNTTGANALYAGWRGGTLQPNSRVYHMRLQYRIGASGPFEDVTFSNGDPVEYKRSELEGHSRYIGPVELPSALLNRPYVELRWNYYYTGIRLDNESGQRTMLSLGDILVTKQPETETTTLTFDGLPATAQADVSLQAFDISARDETGAVDFGFSGEITLEVDEGPGDLLGTTEVTASGGIASFTDLAFTAPGLYVLRATAANTGTEMLSEVIRVTDIHEIVMPKIIQGARPDNDDRIPFAFRLRVEGLKANATYRYYNRIIDDTDGMDQDGAGNMIFVPGNTGDFIRTTGSPDFNPAEAGEGHFELTTDDEGIFEGWFITEPTGNRRFEPGNFVRVRLLLNDGAGGQEFTHRIDTFSDIRVVEFSSEAGGATGMAVISDAIDRNFVLLFQDEDGTGRPVYATVTEQTGISFDDRYAGFFRDWVEEKSGRWAAVLPNELPNGIRRIEERSLLDGFEVNSRTSEDGIWGDGVSTVNPSGGSEMPIIIDLVTDVPINDGLPELPGEIVLKQNYPNPFNPSTYITFGLPETMHVKLEVYSVNGQLVTTLFNGTQSAGFHTVTFDSRNVSIASGVYLYRLEAGSFVQVKKMLLVK